MNEVFIKIRRLVDSKSQLKNIVIIFLGIIIVIFALIIYNNSKKIKEMNNIAIENDATISKLTAELEDLKSTTNNLYSQLEEYKVYLEKQKINNAFSGYSRSITTTTKGGITSTSVKYHKKCDEDVSGSDEGEIIKKCNPYIIVKTFQGYVVAHSWSEGDVGDDVEGDIWWGIGWEDWLIDCKKVNVKIEEKGDWEEVSKWIKENC